MAAAAFVAFALDMATRPVVWLVGIVPDDAFYYLQTARHLAASGRSTFDGLDPTNGYHPGWMVVVTAAAAAIRDPESLLRAAIALSLALHLASSVLLARAAGRLLGRLWGAVAGACWLWNPLPLRLAVQAMETSLALAAVALALLVFVTRIAPRPPRARAPTPGGVGAFAATLALAAWARTDMLALAAVAAVVVAALARRPATGAPRLWPVLAGTLTLSVPVLALVPWWLFSWATVGTPVQDSAAMKALWGAASHEGMPVAARLGEAAVSAGTLVAMTTSALLGPARSAAGAVAAVAGVAIAAAMAKATSRVTRLRWTLAWLGGALLSILSAYGLALSLADAQVWYLGLPGLVLWTAAFCAAATLGRRWPIPVATVLTAGTAALGFLTWREPTVFYPWQADVLRSIPAFEAHVPPGARTGAFNAGIAAYFGHRTVVNLDGLVNHAVHPYWRAHRFDRYLHDGDIGYIADEPDALGLAGQFSSGRVPLTPLASAPLTGWPGGRRYLWRVGP